MPRVWLMTPLLAATLFAFGCKEKQVAAPLEQPASIVPKSFSTSPDFDGQNAYLHCHNICALGPRLSGSPAYAAQLDYLEKHLTAAGWRVERDSFPVRGINMINLRAVKGESTAARPLLLSCHIDTKINISPDFESADDGASGAAVLLEAARILANEPQLAGGVELVFFDGEEAVAPRMTETDGLYGSRYDVQRRGATLPRYQINLDMVGARNKTIMVPIFDSSPALVEAYEAAVKELGLNDKKWTITDDEYWDDDRYFREAGVATINLICDFVGSIWWHTPRDNMKRICPKSLHESGLVTLALIRRVLAMQ